MPGSNNKVVNYDSKILWSNDGELLGSTLGAGDRNIIGIVGGNDMVSPMGYFDGSGLLDGNELGWFVVKKQPTHLPHPEQIWSLLYKYTP